MDYKKELAELSAGNMTIHDETDPPYLSFPHLDRTGLVTDAFSTRLGGVSEGWIVTEEDAGKGTLRERDYTDVDGLITDRPGLMLVTYFADCVPLYFLDPVKKVIALSHSGWRGTAAKMGAVTVRRMQSEFGCDPGEILAGIGPSICRDCYEVDDTVYRGFSESFAPEELAEMFTPGRPGKYQLDLWRANRLILEEAGLKHGNIAVSGLCTACHSSLLFSHRASGGRRGLMCAFLALKS